MNIVSIEQSLSRTLGAGFDFYERRAGKYQLVLPILHEDGDMVDIYLQESPKGSGYVRICDFGLTLMRLSYNYELNTPSRQQIFDSILMNNNTRNESGSLYIDTPLNMLYENILQFAGCVQKVCNMRYWTRETIRSAFYDDLKEYITNSLARFAPVADHIPLPDYQMISVDWTLIHANTKFYIFGVRGNNKAKNVAISLLEFQKAKLPYIGMVVHEDMEDLGKKEAAHLTRNADKQYPALNDFRETVIDDVERLAFTASHRAYG